MTMAQAIRTRIRSAPFDFDFRKLNIEAAQRRVGDILGTPRISNPKGVTTDRDKPIAEPNVHLRVSGETGPICPARSSVGARCHLKKNNHLTYCHSVSTRQPSDYVL